jgi:hypothetical protein
VGANVGAEVGANVSAPKNVPSKKHVNAPCSSHISQNSSSVGSATESVGTGKQEAHSIAAKAFASQSFLYAVGGSYTPFEKQTSASAHKPQSAALTAAGATINASNWNSFPGMLEDKKAAGRGAGVEQHKCFGQGVQM